MTFLAELGLLANTVGLIVAGVLFVGTLLAVHGIHVGREDFKEDFVVAVPATVLAGVVFLFFATRFVKLVWAL